MTIYGAPGNALKSKKSRIQQGFTLVEMLVVVMLFALIMTGLSSAFYTLAQTETRIDQRLEQSNQLRASMAFLDQTLGRVSHRKRPGVFNIEASQFWFDGKNQAMRWVGIMPARYGAGGRYFFQLAVEPDANQQAALVIRFATWQDVPDFPSPDQMDGRVLLSGVTQFSLRYRGAKENPQEWTTDWSLVDQMPSHAWLEISTVEYGVLPMKIVAMRSTSDGQNISDSSIGGVGGRR